MVRISGVDLPNEKRLDIALTYLYGIGRSNVVAILKKADLDSSRRLNSLTDDEVGKLSKIIEKDVMVEGDLRRNIGDNIKRLTEIKAYRGMRHVHRLPAHGQRTRTNARTKRGKRMTVGALKKEDRAKIETKTEGAA
jgi:small subunit ribosomal protein S13